MKGTFAGAVAGTLTGVVAGLLLSGSVFAEQGDWLVRVGAHTVTPKSDNHAVVDVDAATMMTFNATYFVRERLAVEVLAALPFEHDIDLVGGDQVGRTKHLPPTVSLQYHFRPDARFRPYVGVGVNVTEFFQEDTEGALAGADLELDRSVGLAAQVGFDVDITKRWFANLDLRYFDIDTDASLDGADLGTVEIDPWAVGLSLGVRL
ncbi:MAG: OmpW family outer membrane protein [Pseudomonadota bacterium]